MTLRERQSLFVNLLSDLIRYAYDELGYELTWGEAWRPRETAELYAREGRGIVNSLHTDRLAVDFNLFINGRWCPDSESHRPLGEYWEKLHEDCRWGGRFSHPDGNHYSLTFEGRS